MAKVYKWEACLPFIDVHLVKHLRFGEEAILEVILIAFFAILPIMSTVCHYSL